LNKYSIVVSIELTRKLPFGKFRIGRKLSYYEDII
jgi:hypothetical protein